MLNSWIYFAIASAFFASITAILIKLGTADVSSNLATLIRTIVIAFFLIILVSTRHEWLNPLSINKKTLFMLVLSGIATGFSWICYMKAIQQGPVSIVNAIDKMSLLVTVLLAIIFLNEKLNLYQWIGITLISIGSLLVIIK